MKNLGKLFRQIRLSKNWSIRQAAKKIGISYSYLSILEKGVDPRTGKDSNPKPDTLRIISSTYDYPYEELMRAAGYLEENSKPKRKFDLNIFTNNLNLIREDKSLDKLSWDIFKKTDYKISAKQIESYLNGDIEPFPGTFKILSKYAGVSIDFWYMFNNKDTLKKAQEKYKRNLSHAPQEHFSKEYMSFSALDDDIKQWIIDKDNKPYIELAMKAKQKKVSLQALNVLIDTIAREKNI